MQLYVTVFSLRYYFSSLLYSDDGSFGLLVIAVMEQDFITVGQREQPLAQTALIASRCWCIYSLLVEKVAGA